MFVLLMLLHSGSRKLIFHKKIHTLSLLIAVPDDLGIIWTLALMILKTTFGLQVKAKMSYDFGGQCD